MRSFLLLLFLAIPACAQWTTYVGFNFRGTQIYVTDPANTTYVVGDTYPTTRTIGGVSVTFGWTSALGCSTIPTPLDREDGNGFSLTDFRLAGINYTTGACAVFRVDLPAAASYEVRMAMGDMGNGPWPEVGAFYDNTTLLSSPATGTGVPLRSFVDAVGTQYTWDFWTPSNAPYTAVMTTTTFYFKMGPAGSLNTIAHLGFKQLAGGGGGGAIAHKRRIVF